MGRLLKKLREEIKVKQVEDKLDGKKTWWAWIIPKIFIR